MTKFWLTLITLCGFSCPATFAQEKKQLIVEAVIIGTDTLPSLTLAEVVIHGHVQFRTLQQEAAYQRLVRNLKKVYPYAKLAAVKMNEINSTVGSIQNDFIKEKKLKEAEEDLKAQFETDIREFTETQGDLFIKLIYRQTGNSSYEIIKRLRGNFNAYVWQTVAKLFGHNLKEGYDPTGADKDIEIIIGRIDRGEV